MALQKAGKDDYSDVKAYRPIALLNTLGKVLESILADRISYLFEAHKLLSITHTGGRKVTSTEHALHYLVAKTHAAWNQGKLEGFGTATRCHRRV